MMPKHTQNKHVITHEVMQIGSGIQNTTSTKSCLFYLRMVQGQQNGFSKLTLYYRGDSARFDLIIVDKYERNPQPLITQASDISVMKSVN